PLYYTATSTTPLYTLSLHDALPISFTTDLIQKEPDQGLPATLRTEVAFVYDEDALYVGARMFSDTSADIETVMTRRDESGVAERSEEHTSELQSPYDLVCRLLLEKK